MVFDHGHERLGQVPAGRDRASEHRVIEAESFGFRFDEADLLVEADLFVVDALDDLLLLAEAPERLLE